MSNNDVETAVPVRGLVRDKSVTMEYFLETSHLDQATADLLRRYDVDGDGSFSKDEVVAIILDLREAMQSNEMLGASNKLFKRMLVAATFFCVLLLTSMFGLSYAVAALTAKTDVRSDGVMLTADGASVIATDSTATIHHISTDEDGLACVTAVEMAQMSQSVLDGRNVLLENDSVNGTHKNVDQLSAGGYVYDEETGKMCFGSSNTDTSLCFEVTEACASEEHRQRRLETYDSFDDLPEDCQDLNGVYPTPIYSDVWIQWYLCVTGTSDIYQITCGCYTGLNWQFSV